MRFIALSVLVVSAVAAAQELSPPPLPPEVTPDSVLPQAAPVEPKSFTSAFSSRLSFFSMNEKLKYEVSLGEGREHCTTPCSIDTTAGYSEFTVTRGKQTFTEEHLVPSGINHVLIKNYSSPLLTAGVVLMSLSATAVIAAIVMTALFPYGFAMWLLIIVAPAAAVGVPGSVLTAVGSHRPTATFVPYRGM